MDLNWQMLGPAPDIGQRFQEGMQQGHALVKQRQAEGALNALANDPSDPVAQNALFRVNPELAIQMQSMGIKRAQMQTQQQAGQMYASGNTAGAVRLVAAINPEMAKHYQELDDAGRKAVKAKYEAAGPVLTKAASLPYEQRRQLIASAAPALLGQGWTQQELAGFDPTDDNLRGLATAVHTVQQVDDDGKVTWHPVGEGGILPTDKDGHPIGLNTYPGMKGSVMAPVHNGAAPPQVQSKAQYDALAPGAEYLAPDGSHRVKGGAGTAAAPRTF